MMVLLNFNDNGYNGDEEEEQDDDDDDDDDGILAQNMCTFGQTYDFYGVC